MMSKDTGINKKITCEIISHRGLNRLKSSGRRKGENTMEAFETGIKMLEILGYHKAIEFDIRLSKDNIPIVIHDSTVDRTTDGVGFVGNYTLVDLQKLDAGYGRKIPALSEVFEFFKNKNIFFNIELKEKNIADLVGEIIYKYNLQNKVVISAFDEDDPDKPSDYPDSCSSWSDLFSIKKKLPIALLATNKKINKMGLNNYIEFTKKNRACAINPEDISVNKKLVELAHKAGLSVKVWTVNDPKVYKKFSEYGVDGVFCDNPSFLVKKK